MMLLSSVICCLTLFYTFHKEHRSSARFTSSQHRRQQAYIPNTVISVIRCHALVFSFSLYSVVSSFFPVDAPPPHLLHDILGLCGILTFRSCWEINYLSTFEIGVGTSWHSFSLSCHFCLISSFFCCWVYIVTFPIWISSLYRSY